MTAFSRLHSRVVGLPHDRHGSVLPLVAVAIGVLIYGTAAGISYSSAARVKGSTQTALDAAVLAAAMLPIGTPPTDRVTTAQQVFQAQQTSTTQNLAQPIVPDCVSIGTNADPGVQCSATAQARNFFSGILGKPTIPVSGSAAAKKTPSSPVCAYALNTFDSGAVDLNGTVSVTMNCPLQANSNDKAAIRAVGNAKMSTQTTSVVGNASGKQALTPPPNVSAPSIPDPYANLPFPPKGSCAPLSGERIKSSTTINPGTYCGGLDISSGAQVTFTPGIYIFDGGDFKINGATVTGDQVLLSFTGKGAKLWLTGGAVMNVTSPTSGTWMNMQFMEDTTSSNGNHWVSIGGNSTLNYNGVMYFPNSNVWIYGGSIVNGTSPTVIMIGGELWFQDNSVITLTQANTRNLPVAAAPSVKTNAYLIK